MQRHRFAPLATALVLLLATVPATAATTISITSKANGGSQPVNLGQPTVQVDAGFKTLDVGFTVDFDLSGSGGVSQAGANVAVGAMINTIDDTLPGLIVGDLPDPLPAPLFQPSLGTMRVGYTGGQADTSTEGIGLGPAHTAEIVASFQMDDTLTVTVPTPITLELPLTLSGEAHASAFGDVNTHAYAKLEIHGALGSASVGTFEAVADVHNNFLQVSIDESRVVSLDLAAGTHQIPFSIGGSGTTASWARGWGYLGVYQGTAASGITFPDTVEVGLFTGPGGTPLPRGTTIVGAEGIPYPFSMVPEPLSLVLVATAVGAMWLRFRRDRLADGRR